ncbi:hypothetical protein GORDON_41 [Arthrobacter phage Gordon]|uniref:Membrane protein n=3 Tax=Gordonvirus TaxID=1982152 RepID=A0A9E7P8W6_9CAUD|nr:hypothetical protein FDH69_gp41 [Arthrobacter phage Gordon]YP_010750404.1 membrane protein [Arthrobacter phage Trustiboi]YP_010750676.1 membrane protein [Arthrobacter phage ScienceWizSam]ALY09016.1 hypothetical protein GORDON_41 [Arthrobacter phage Gordon]UTN91606.1 membrane protein [Arthrobacter phage Trustiboi]UUG69288.1 membrane protein [Arthrobacter phage ScienceWizSam]
MSEIVTFKCKFCEHTTDIANDVMPLEDYSGMQCVSSDACDRRKKRNNILAEMQEMAKKPHVHPVDKVTRTTVLLCGIFMGAVSGMGLSYLLFGV